MILHIKRVSISASVAMGSWTHWQSLGEVTLPPCLIGHSAVLFNKNMYVFGGIDDLTGPSDFLWTFDLSKYEKRTRLAIFFMDCLLCLLAKLMRM